MNNYKINKCKVKMTIIIIKIFNFKQITLKLIII